MKKLKNFLCYFLSFFVIISLTSGCGNNSTNKNHAIKNNISNHKKHTPKTTVVKSNYLPPTLVIPTIKPETKVAYLTFDDGPSPHITPKILDLLKLYNIKGTFFVIGSLAKKYPKIMKRIYYEGHAIGNHSYSHKYKQIYASWENLNNEINTTNKVIFDTTGGYKCYLFRAPGGSKPSMNQTFFDNIHSKGFKIFDWNCLNGDGVKHGYSEQQLFANFISSSNHNHLYFLMHCKDDNYNSYLSLKDIIIYLKNKGYIFLPINQKTPELHF